MYHQLPITMGLQRLYPLFYFAFSVAFLRAGVRTLCAYLFQSVTNHMKDELFSKALGCRRFYLLSHRDEINHTIHYYLDREFLKTSVWEKGLLTRQRRKKRWKLALNE